MAAAGDWNTFDTSTRVKAELYQVERGEAGFMRNVKRYVDEGRALDLRYVRQLCGLLDFAERRGFNYFWESPFVEEHAQETVKRRRIQQRQRQNNLSRVIGSADDPAKVEETYNLIKRLEEQDAETTSATEPVKTVSKVVQSFEKRAVRNMLTFLQSSQDAQGYLESVGMANLLYQVLVPAPCVCVCPPA